MNDCIVDPEMFYSGYFYLSENRVNKTTGNYDYRLNPVTHCITCISGFGLTFNNLILI